MIVPPDLEPRFTEPEGWRWGLMENANGKNLRFGTVCPKNTPRANVVILPGRSECIEKYFETAHDLLERDCCVWIMEWQGQGLSTRFLEKHPQRNHSISFDFHAKDLRQFIHEQIIPNARNAPLIMLAQSMGGNIGMRYLHAEQGYFKSAAFCAPMLGIQQIDGIPAGKHLVKAISLIAGEYYAYGQKDWDRLHNPAGTTILSSDSTRSKMFNSWLLANPELRVGGVTYSWINHAVSSCDFLKKPDTLKKITIPCLVAVGGNEHLVSPLAIRMAAAMLPHAKFLEIPEASHEILMECDSMRNQFLSAFDEIALNT